MLRGSHEPWGHTHWSFRGKSWNCCIWWFGILQVILPFLLLLVSNKDLNLFIVARKKRNLIQTDNNEWPLIGTQHKRFPLLIRRYLSMLFWLYILCSRELVQRFQLIASQKAISKLHFISVSKRVPNLFIWKLVLFACKVWFHIHIQLKLISIWKASH